MLEKKLIEYLKANNAYDSFNKKQRIILIASEFDKQTLSAVAWLITNNVDIACYKINPIRIAENTFLNIERILPKDKNEDYFVAIDEKGEVIRHLNKKINRTIKPRMKSLFDAGILKEKDIIVFKNKENSDAEVVDYKKVIYQGKEMSYVEWGKLITGWSAVCIYEWAKKKGEDKTLDDYRDEL